MLTVRMRLTTIVCLVAASFTAGVFAKDLFSSRQKTIEIPVFHRIEIPKLEPIKPLPTLAHLPEVSMDLPKMEDLPEPVKLNLPSIPSAHDNRGDGGAEVNNPYELGEQCKHPLREISVESTKLKTWTSDLVRVMSEARLCQKTSGAAEKGCQIDQIVEGSFYSLGLQLENQDRLLGSESKGFQGFFDVTAFLAGLTSKGPTCLVFERRGAIAAVLYRIN